MRIGGLVRTEAKIAEPVTPAEGQSWHNFLGQEREAAIAEEV